jgi:hypothetical protein
MKIPRLLVVLAVILIVVSFGASTVFAEEKPDTPHARVVGEFIRSLGSIHNAMLRGSKELKEDSSSSDPPLAMMATMIRSSTRITLELNTSINVLKSISLAAPFDKLLPNTIKCYEQKLELYGEMASIAKTLVSGTPQKGVDYSKQAGRMPEITASLEFLDQTIFKSITPIMFMLLIDQKPDSLGQLSRLVITKAEKMMLIDRIDNAFGDSLKDKEKNYIVGSAAMLKKCLLNIYYKCGDE